ncbi:alpha/beta hydrolase [Lacticaseibacillus absianus]|uniref:alpha/beta hydrolase n=1 Tax=Lacticaseibacillus absianus TaxID=2729623 RepID=UPI0015C794AC|nr:alpha/beta fold hydrolase [Lacticaseibacillus absianus]
MQAFELTGQGLGVVLLHAYTGSPADVNLLAHALNRSGAGVLAPLFAGHGTGDAQDVFRAGPTQWWAQTQAAIAQVQARYPRVAVFGLSLGGLFAMRALATLPGLACGGVLSSPVMPGTDDVPRQFLGANRAQRKRRGLPDNTAAITPALTAQLTAIHAFAAATVPLLGGITQPVFIGQGSQDVMIDPARAQALVAALHQAPVTFREYPAGHVITVNAAHTQLEQDIIQFLE